MVDISLQYCLRTMPQMLRAPCAASGGLHSVSPWNHACREILPIAACFAISLATGQRCFWWSVAQLCGWFRNSSCTSPEVTSNMAYKYCTVAFLQMMKESNIVTRPLTRLL